MDRTAHRFLERNYLPNDRLAFVAIDRSYGPRRPNDSQVLSEIRRMKEKDKLLPELEQWNKANWDVYVSVNPLKEEARRRMKEDVREVKHIFADFDVDAKERIAAMIDSKRVPRPNEIVSTSPGKSQAIWKVQGFGKEQAESLSRGLVREFGADPAATDVNRVMRLPGFRNNKYVPSQYVNVTIAHSRIAAPDQFPVYEQERQQGPVRGYERGRSAASGITNSEKDWALVKEGLKHGRTRDELIAELASMRTDKPNPGYYARLTVGNAEKSLSRGR